MSKRLTEPWARYDRLFFKSAQFKAMPERWRGNAYLFLLGLSGYARHMELDGVLSLPEAAMVAAEMGYPLKPMLCALSDVGLAVVVDDHVRLPKYEKWNETSAEIAEARTHGRIAAETRWTDARSNASGNARSNTSGNARSNTEKRESRERVEGEAITTVEVNHHVSNGSSPEPLSEGLDPSEALCIRLAELNVERGKRTVVTPTWRHEARLLTTRDEHPLDEALDLLDWACHHHFWRKNIWSLPKFREQYARLQMDRDDELARTVKLAPGITQARRLEALADEMERQEAMR